MRFLFLCLIILLAFTGCYSEKEGPSAVDYVRSEENQTRHFRPVHQDHPDWTIGVLGKNLKLRTENDQIRISTRRNPDQLVVRQDGRIVGHVQGDDHGVVTYVDENEQHEEINQTKDTISLTCDKNRNVELALNQQKKLYSIRSADEMSSGNLYLKKLDAKHRYSISERSAQDEDSGMCTGNELESPFNALGTMLFHTETVPLPARTALAWYVTVFDFKCDDLTKQ